MQDRQTFLGWWEHFRQVNGITLRIVSALPADKFDSRPIPNMRTPKELLVHMYGMIVRNIPVGMTRAEVVNCDEKAAVASLKTRDDVLRYCREQWAEGDAAARTITDANLQSAVKTPWGMDAPGSVMAAIISDEYMHHRGQLYAYARALGVEPPMVWDFEHNEAAFAPKATAEA